MVGVFDLASNVSEGVRNTTTVFDNPARDRVRLVSFFFATGSLSLTWSTSATTCAVRLGVGCEYISNALLRVLLKSS